MKVFMIFCVLFNVVAVYSGSAHDQHNIETEKEKINAQNEECVSEHGIDLKMMFHEIKTNKNFDPTRAMLCFAACLLKKNGFMNADGSLTRKYNDSASAQECKNLTGRDECDAAFKIMNCLNKHDFLRTGDN